jgi:hypothetical protein
METVHFGRVDERRYALFAAPVAGAAHASGLAENLTRALDPRVCPLLRRALPYGWCGVSIFPETAHDAVSLLACAEQDMEQRRRAARGCKQLLRVRRQHALKTLLQPASVRDA